MADYEEKILVSLVEKYRKSKKDSGTNVTARRTRIFPREIYRNYNRNDGDMAQIEALNRAAQSCRKMGFVTFDMEGFSSEIQAIYLVDEKIEKAEDYLEKTYRYEPKARKRACVEEIIAAYSGRSPAADRECAKLGKALEKNRIPAKYRQTEELLKALVFIENNEKELLLREASVLIYGDSKYLEENMLHPVCRTLRDFLEKPCGEGELEDEILEVYHIVKERRRICFKGDVTVRIAGQDMELGAFSEGFEMFAGELERIEQIRVNTGVFMTIENYTSWLRMKKGNAVLFYLGGYIDRDQREFLKKVYADNPGLSFLHFGDIDAGGLYIHEHLCRVTGIPFSMYRMSQRELENERFRFCLHPLTEQDRIRLESLKKQEAYRDLAAYMLENNVKLEQEIISYYEAGVKNS